MSKPLTREDFVKWGRAGGKSKSRKKLKAAIKNLPNKKARKITVISDFRKDGQI